MWGIDIQIALHQQTIPSEMDPLMEGDWLMDKDMSCWVNQELYHMEIDEPCAWTLDLSHINR